MVSGLFESLLTELGTIMGVSLFPDSNNSCLIKLKSGVKVQMELDTKGEQFIIGIDLGPVPPGQYRQSLFREALRANGFPHPRLGVLAFSKKNGHMVLTDTISVQDLNGERIAFRLTPLTEKGLKWKDAIEHGEIPPVEAPSKRDGQSPMSMFGMRP